MTFSYVQFWRNHRTMPYSALRNSGPSSKGNIFDHADPPFGISRFR